VEQLDYFSVHSSTSLHIKIHIQYVYIYVYIYVCLGNAKDLKNHHVPMNYMMFKNMMMWTKSEITSVLKTNT